MIGNCDNCDRRNVPVSGGQFCGCDTMQCFICQGEDGPDPYGELPEEDGFAAPERGKVAQEWVDEYVALRDKLANFLAEFKKSAASVNMLCGPRPIGQKQRLA